MGAGKKYVVEKMKIGRKIFGVHLFKVKVILVHALGKTRAIKLEMSVSDGVRPW